MLRSSLDFNWIKISNASNTTITNSTQPINMVVNSYTFVLMLMYLAITSVVGFQIIRILYYKHNLLAFQFSFLSLSFVWAIIRCIYFFWCPNWYTISPSLSDALYLVPYWLQFATFSLLILFYAFKSFSETSRIEASYHLKLALIVYVLINGILAVFLIVNTILQSEVSKHQTTFVTVEQYIISILYLLLDIGLAYFGWKISDIKIKVKVDL